MAAQVKRLERGGVLRELTAGTELGRAVSDVQRYARGATGERVLESILGELGPVGSLIQALLRPRGGRLAGVDQELAVASDLLRQFGFKVVRPDRRPAVQRRAEQVDEARALLERLGFTVAPTEEPPAKPPGAREFPARPKPGEAPFPLGTHGEQRMVGGRRLQYPADDPILTGEMIEVSSSNVHSIGFLWNHSSPMAGTLVVRFLQSGKGSRKAGPGPVYHYHGVNPAVFDAFRRAASKGEFVWDRLRVRGTVSGHRYRYDLAGVVNGYVPRQAKRYGSNEYFVGRRLTFRSERTGERRTIESALPDERVNRGRPPGVNRGERTEPNRGR